MELTKNERREAQSGPETFIASSKCLQQYTTGIQVHELKILVSRSKTTLNTVTRDSGKKGILLPQTNQFFFLTGKYIQSYFD